MNKLSLATLLLGGLLAAGTAQADDGVLAPFHADYSLIRNSTGLGTSSFTLSKDGDSYVYKSTAHATGIASLFSSAQITQESRFGLADGRPRADSYSYSDSSKAGDAETIHFDWNKHVGTTEENGQHKDKVINGDTSDVQLIQLLLAWDVANGKLADKYRLLDHGGIASYNASLRPDAQLKLGSKSYDTKVVELKNPDNGRTITVWLAPGQHYLPVQIRQAQPDKATITLALQDASFGAAAPSASAGQ